MTDDILFERHAAADIVTLNRPKTLNAVTHDMVQTLRAQLDRWTDNTAVTRIIITATGKRAFSTDNDIQTLTDLDKTGRHNEALQFQRDEYPLNAAIKSFRKPYIALINGIAMGDKVNVSMHDSHRVVGDRFSFAIPEVDIGFFPNVGTTWFLPHMPNKLSTYCALASERFGIANAIKNGIATHRVPSARFGSLLDELTSAISVDAVIAAFSESTKKKPIMQRKAAIDRLFVSNQIKGIIDALDREASLNKADSEWAKTTAATMRTKSPLSLKLALAQMRRKKNWNFETCMRAEFRIVSRIIHGHDFYENVRAMIVDKNNKPRWQPATLAKVSKGEIERHFAPLGGAKLVL